MPNRGKQTTPESSGGRDGFPDSSLSPPALDGSSTPTVELTDKQRKEHLDLLDKYGDFPKFSFLGEGVKPTDKTVRRRYEVPLGKDGHKYPLLPGDVLTGGMGRYSKHAPGIALAEIEIPDEEVITWQEYVDAVRGSA